MQFKVSGGGLVVLVAGTQRFQHFHLSPLLAHRGLSALPNDHIIKTDDDYECAEHPGHPAPREHHNRQFLVLRAFKPKEEG